MLPRVKIQITFSVNLHQPDKEFVTQAVCDSPLVHFLTGSSKVRLSYIASTVAIVAACGISLAQLSGAESKPAAGESEVDPNAPIELIEERYDDGKIKVRREVTLDMAGNYVKQGQWKAFQEDGSEVAAGTFANNKRTGEWFRTLNHSDADLLQDPPFAEFEGPFVSRAQFKDGKLHGIWTITDSKNRVASEWPYKAGLLDGTAKWFYPDGSLREQVTYTNGLIDGHYTLWDQNGNELDSEVYQLGRKLAMKEETYPNGELKWQGMFLHESYQIKESDNWWDTRPVTFEKSGQPARHGRFTSWYENGKKKFEGMFDHETKAGEFTWWHENTQRAVLGSFKDNERHGVWTWWHENGQKAITGLYENGDLSGKWSYWDADGMLVRKMDYTDDADPIAIHSVPSTAIPNVANNDEPNDIR